jgi:hypothetical protein
MILRSCVTAIVLSVALNSPVLATATWECTIKDKNVELALSGVAGHSDEYGVVVQEGNLTVQARDGWPALMLDVVTEDKVTTNDEHALSLIQQWRHNHELRLWLNSNKVDFILLMKQKEADAPLYYGAYEFRQKNKDGKERKYSGQARCWIYL